jgi:hypothetical protein
MHSLLFHGFLRISLGCKGIVIALLIRRGLSVLGMTMGNWADCTEGWYLMTDSDESVF